MASFYVTTPIYYVNGAPHIGHAYTTIVADVMARCHRLRGEDVFFMTGTDEHGLKVQRAAEDRGITPLALADENSAKFRALFDELRLTHDRFIRTSEDVHKKTATQIFERMKANGDIYLGSYEGWYAASDEAYYAEDEIEDGCAKATGAKVEWVSESSYFFKLSAYQDRLLDWYRSQPECVRPQARYNEVFSFVEGGLSDLSISRTTFDWGVPVPGDPEHVMYVWVDALTNYITGVGAFGEDDEAFEKYWPCDVHLIGKDILRFHAVYWPAFLMSAGLPLPKQIWAHGWWLNEGVKMSKTLGNFIDAFALARDYDLDVLRYYLLREVPFGNDGNFASLNLRQRNNSELADNFGNLVNRTLKMAERFVGGVLPEVGAPTEEIDVALVAKAKEARAEYDAAIDALEFHRALEIALGLSADLNLYLQENQPWKLAKDESTKARCGEVLYHTIEGIRWVALLLSPFVPDAAAATLVALGEPEDGGGYATLEQWGRLPGGRAFSTPDVLFTKIELPKKEDGEEKGGKKAKPKKRPAPEGGYIGFDDFTKVHLRCGLVLSARRVEGSDKLLHLMVDLGDEEPHSVASGIAQSIAPEEIEGKRFVFVTNLKPRKVFKIPSEAMLLAADTADGGLSLASLPDSVPAGAEIS